MIVYGYVKNFKYAGDGTMQIQVRIPNIHGAYRIEDYQGKTAKNYTPDSELPWYPSLLLAHKPAAGEVVALTTLDNSPSNWLVIGLTGGSYHTGATKI